MEKLLFLCLLAKRRRLDINRMIDNVDMYPKYKKINY
jgi:hypothetical protein